MAGPIRRRDDPLLLHSLQLLATRRFELYTTLAPLLADLEEAIDEKSVRRIIETFADVHRRMRESLAFLNRPVYRALLEIEDAIGGGGESAMAVDHDRLGLALLRLHVEMGRALREPAFETIENILDLGAGLRAQLAGGASTADHAPPDPRIQNALDRARRGRKLITARKYRAATREFRKALSLAPGDPMLRVDLGHALLLAGDPLGAVAELSAARDRFTEEAGAAGSRRRATRLLGRARRALSEEKFRKRQVEEALAEMKGAVADLETSLVGEPEDAERKTVGTEIDACRQRLALWETIRRKISSLPDAPMEKAEGGKAGST